jgi:hypothetical protein
MLQPVLCANGWAVVQRDFEEHELHDNHEAGLQKERVAVVCPEPVEDPGSRSFQYSHATPTFRTRVPYLRIEATSIIRGMSSEKPSLLLERWIEKI